MIDKSTPTTMIKILSGVSPLVDLPGTEVLGNKSPDARGRVVKLVTFRVEVVSPVIFVEFEVAVVGLLVLISQ